MRRKTLCLLVYCLIIFAYIQPSFAGNALELNNFQLSKLEERKSTWPDWHLPYTLKRPSLKNDLIYPEWFEGTWDVSNKLEGNEIEEPIFHSAKFLYIASGKLVADRQYNTNSYALSTKDSEFLNVKNDPESPNRQFAKLIDDRFLETIIIGRLQEQINNNIFLTDELTLQILHDHEFTRISQVETLTEFKKCGVEENHFTEESNFNICGKQFQAIYKQPGENLISLPIKTQKSNLILTKTN